MARKDANPGAKEAAAQRRLAVVEYRKAGMPVRAIALRLGVSHTTVVADIQAVMDEVNAKTLSNGKVLQALQYERYEMALMAIATKVARGELGAIDRWVDILKNQSVLMGLNAPMKIAPTDPDGEEYRADALSGLEKIAARMAAYAESGREGSGDGLPQQEGTGGPGL